MKKTGSLKAALEKLSGKAKVVRVGFLEEATYPNADGEPLPVAQVAYWNEYGTTGEIDVEGGGFFHHIPLRPFFRKTIAEHSSEWGKQAAQLLKSNNYDVDVALNKLGDHIAGQITETIRTYKEPSNAQSTIKKKGFNAPLRETGTMARLISYEVSDDES